MFISFLSFHFITSFLLLLNSSVSITIEKKCSTDDDCDLELICNTKTKTCTCSKGYFWRNDIHACVGCPPGWLELQTRKCLLFAIGRTTGLTWYQAQTTCKKLLAQPMRINNINEFQAFQHQIEYILNGVNALSATLYFHQGAWVEMNHKSMESYTWCNKDEKRDCVQIRQDNRTNAICLQYISCVVQSHFICEASPLLQLELEKNIAEVEHSNINERNKEIIVRHSRQVKALPAINTRKVRNIPPEPTEPVDQLMMTTKKPSIFNSENIMNLISTGIKTAGQVSNAIGNIFGKRPTQPPAIDNSYIHNEPQYLPQALASEESSDSSSSNVLLYGGLIGGGLLVLIIIVSIIVWVVCSKKKTSSTSKSSVRSTDSETSVVSNE